MAQLLGNIVELRVSLRDHLLVVWVERAQIHHVCLSVRHDVAHFADELELSQLIDQVALDIAGENGLRVALDHDFVGFFRLFYG